MSVYADSILKQIEAKHQPPKVLRVYIDPPGVNVPGENKKELDFRTHYEKHRDFVLSKYL